MEEENLLVLLMMKFISGVQCRKMSAKTLTYSSSNCGLSYSFLTFLMETRNWHRDRKMHKKYLEAQYVILHQL